MRHLINPARGDLIDHRQTRMHAALRRALQMGHTEESQRMAMQLLRRAQASKGDFLDQRLVQGLRPDRAACPGALGRHT